MLRRRSALRAIRPTSTMPGIPISQKPRIARKSVMLDILGQRRLCHFLLFYVVLRPAVHRETPQRRQIQDGMETDFLKEQAPIAVRCRRSEERRVGKECVGTG